MPKVLFNCPNCSFNKEISQNEIPPEAKNCKCPSCKKVLSLSEAIKPLERNEDLQQTPPNSREEGHEEAAGSQNGSTRDADASLEKYHELLDEALSTLKKNNELEAMLLLEEAEKISSTPKVRSYLAYCRARVKNEFSTAIQACTQALREEPRNADHYLNLGRIYFLVNKRGPALQAFRKGLKLGPNSQLMQEMRKFKMRKPAVISSLSRDHVLNHKLGQLLSRLGLR